MIIAAAIAIAFPAFARAQSLENAFAFFDQVMMNRATVLTRHPTVERSINHVRFTPTSSQTSQCRTTIAGNTVPADYFPSASASIAWTQVIEVRPLSRNAERPGLVIIGGGYTRVFNGSGNYDHSTGPTAGITILTGSAAMDTRLTNAINVIIANCADRSLGF
ncbi:hypothetical protein AAW00_13535 [Aurantiacibacter luteus]|uniref:Uncharacterized protein n=2 Tax=Aurantiacibacter luteus TaxID=1581420 RepID=A0A0G9MP00_9SPHN|nr:hypothetical protein AAW00_13535 [Aurantiacibacter luteus]